MALTVATTVDQNTNDQPGNFGRLRARREIVTFTAGYDSTTGVTLTHASCGLSQIVAVIPEGTTNVGSTAQIAVGAVTGDATITLFNGTTKVATSDQSATTLACLVIGH